MKRQSHKWTSTHRCVRIGRPASTYIQQLCANIGGSLEDLPGAAIDDRREREKENQGSRARGVMVIVVGNWHGDTSSNPGRDWLHFT